MWVWPQVPLGRPSPSTPYDLGPLPHTSLGRTLPEYCKKSQGVGGRGRGKVGREGLWSGKGPPVAMGGMGGGPPNGSWGQTHIWGLSKKQRHDNLQQRHDNLRQFATFYGYLSDKELLFPLPRGPLAPSYGVPYPAHCCEQHGKHMLNVPLESARPT